MGAQFKLSRVGVAFGERRALDAVDLEIAAGEAVALVGPSGAGKTSFLRLLNGSLRPTLGEVHVAGRPLQSLSRREARELRASVGFIPQHLGLVGSLRVARNVLSGRLGRQSFAGSLRSMLAPSNATLAEVHALLERVGIEERLYERTDRLSGGEQQRVALARALYQDPLALVADEPVSSLDPARARDAIELLTRTSSERGLTLCVSLHSLELARACFARLIGLREGRVVFDCPTDSLAGSDFRALYALSDDAPPGGASGAD